MAIQIITSSEFRNNQKHYLDKAKEEGVVYISQRNEGVFSLRPTSEIELYYSNPKVQEALQEAREQIKAGETYEMLPDESLDEFMKRTASCIK